MRRKADKEKQERILKSRPPAQTVEGRENQLISLAVELAEKRLADGTASNQLIVEMLRRGSTKERLEKEILEKQREMITAKTDALRSAKRIEELYADAISAFRTYSPDINNEVNDAHA